MVQADKGKAGASRARNRRSLNFLATSQARPPRKIAMAWNLGAGARAGSGTCSLRKRDNRIPSSDWRGRFCMDLPCLIDPLYIAAVSSNKTATFHILSKSQAAVGQKGRCGDGGCIVAHVRRRVRRELCQVAYP
jgi:hypothetical protein